MGGLKSQELRAIKILLGILLGSEEREWMKSSTVRNEHSECLHGYNVRLRRTNCPNDFINLRFCWQIPNLNLFWQQFIHLLEWLCPAPRIRCALLFAIQGQWSEKLVNWNWSDYFWRACWWWRRRRWQSSRCLLCLWIRDVPIVRLSSWLRTS